MLCLAFLDDDREVRCIANRGIPKLLSAIEELSDMLTLICLNHTYGCIPIASQRPDTLPPDRHFPIFGFNRQNPTVVPISSATMAAAVGEHGLAPHSHIGGSYHRHPLIASSSFTLCATYRNRSPSQQSTRQCAKEFLEPHSYSGNEATSTPCCKQPGPACRMLLSACCLDKHRYRTIAQVTW